MSCVRRTFCFGKHLCLLVFILYVFKGSELLDANAESDNTREIGSFGYTKSGFYHQSRDSESAEKSKAEESGCSSVSFSTPSVEIKPYLLDWGQKNMYYPSLDFPTVKNVDTTRVLSVYDIDRSNTQFYYPFSFLERSLVPSEYVLSGFVYLPTRLGLSSGQSLLQTSFGGFFIRTKGFNIETPYSEYSLLNAEEGLDVKSGDKAGRMKIATTPREKWEIGTQETESFIELDGLPVIYLMHDKLITQSKYGSSVAEDAITQAVINPYGRSASFGHIPFHPFSSCEWRCSALIKDNISSIEQLSPLVIRIGVSGSNCGRDEFAIHICKGLLIPPSESVRNLELMLASGVLVISTKASLLVYMLGFCKRSMILMGLKKAMILIISAASLVTMLVFLFFPSVKNPNVFNHSSKLFNWGKRSSTFSQTNKSKKSRGEKLLLESANRCSNVHASDKLNINFSAQHMKQTNHSSDNKTEIGSKSSESSSVEHMEDSSSSPNIKVRTGKDKRSRRRGKKRTSGIVLTSSLEVSSSQSGDSTPSSPASSLISVETKNISSHSPDANQQHYNKITKHTRPAASSRDSLLDANKVSSSPHLCKNPSFSSEKRLQSGTKKITRRAFLVPVAQNGITSSSSSPWTRKSLFSASTSRIIDSHARAPGTKLLDIRKSDQVVENIKRVDEKYTYDIWGDHLFGLSLYYNSNKVSSIWSGGVHGNNNYQSFFVQEPKILFTNSVVQRVSSNMEGNDDNNIMNK